MKIGEYSFKRRYSLAQILIDIFTACAVGYLLFVIYVCASDIQKLNELNRTDADMSMFDWRPLLIWPCIALVIIGISLFLLFRKRKKPLKYTVTKHNVRKYCNIIDTCLGCVRLMLVITLCECANIHFFAIMMRDQGFPVQLLLDVLIIAGIFAFTRIRLTALSDSAREAASQEEQKSYVQD